MWKIGPITIEGKVVLGPMAGITTLAYRDFMKDFGVAVSYTEMVSDCGLIYKNEATYKYLELSLKDHPIGLQLFGGKKETLVKAIHLVEKLGCEYDFLDINLGCPMPKVTRSGAGSAWLKRLDELKDAMTAVVQTSSKPVTAKIRIGWDSSSINFMETIQALEEAGVSMICVHARTTSQIYSGTPRYDLIEDLRLKMKVPLVISGDIFTLDDAVRALTLTHADAVMVARGSLGHPKLVSQIDSYFKTGVRLPDPTLGEQLRYLQDFAHRLIKLKGEKLAIRELRGIGTHFLTGYPGMRKFKGEMSSSMETLADLNRIVEEIQTTVLTTQDGADKL